MPLTIQCIHCGVVLNLPPNVAGRRLKCPKCGERFQIGPAGVDASPAPNNANPPTDNPDSTLLLSRLPSASQLPTMPSTGGGDLREMFDLPMMTESAPPAAKSTIAPAAKSTIAPTTGGGEAADVAGLFGEEPAPRKKKTGAEARSHARKCPTCNGVVPAGMSLCQSCGLDLESGTRVSLIDDLTPPAPPAPTGLPIPLTVVGGLCMAASVALTALALVKWYQKVPGGIFFVPIALFGIYASVQFLRAKTVKLLLVALALGAMLDIVFMLGAPIIQAMNETAPIEQKITPEGDPEIEDVMIKPFAERLDMASVTRGIVLLVLYSGVSIYLLSPQVSRHMRK